MTAPEPPAPPTRQPTIRIRCDASGNVEAIETYQGPAGWRNILIEPIQRGDAADLVAALVDVRERPARDAACAHATTIRGADIPLRHGSWRSEVCHGCGAFRARNHHDELITWGPLSSWRPASEYADATDEGDRE